MEKIESRERFIDIQKQASGYIGITDSANPNKIHAVTCAFVSLKNFDTKVVVNNCKNGSYYWVQDVSHAMMELNASPCMKCMALSR